MTHTRLRSAATPTRPRPRRRLTVALTVTVALSLAACGSDTDDGDGLSAGDATQDEATDGGRTVEIAMVDNEFQPGELDVAAGETVRFLFANEGQVTHDAVIGDEAAQAEHEDEMRAAEDDDTAGDDMGGGEDMDGMGHGSGEGEGDEEGAITVEPGETGELTHSFAADDQLLIGCHEPGHYDDGMRVVIDVAAA